MEEVHQLGVVGLAAKVPLQDAEHSRLQEERVVDGNHLHIGFLVPTGLTPPGLRVVHDVVRHQEEGLQPLHTPPQGSGPVQLAGRQLLHPGGGRQPLVHLHHRAPAIQFATFHVVVVHVGDPVNHLLRHLVVAGQIIHQLLGQADVAHVKRLLEVVGQGLGVGDVVLRLLLGLLFGHGKHLGLALEPAIHAQQRVHLAPNEEVSCNYCCSMGELFLQAHV
mmetsp:Transcript_13583/g.19959  ORF Transcript_13583/g.19959 Transcript_13583/m.19959 type:complete len:220 (-) Transcript_13583:265-924(-)